MSEEIQHKNCLVLNSDYSPLTIISWQKALTWFIKYEDNPKYGIEIVDFYKDDCVIGVNKNYPLPAVAKTKRFFKINNNSLTFSRKNIYLRDEYKCQYCGKKFDTNELTYDHVVPKSQWVSKLSPTSWTNIVTACVSCNRKKGNRTPKQANMVLKTLPIKPNKTVRYLPITQYLSKIRMNIPNEWIAYLPTSYL